MAIHSFKVSIVTPGTIGAGAAAAVIRAAAAAGPGARPTITRIAVMVHASPTSQTYLDIYRVPVGNIGTPTGGTSVLGQGMASADVSATNVDTVWSGNPTLPGSPVRIDGWSGAGTLGAGYVFSFADLTLEPNTGLLLWCPSAAGQLRITPEWNE